MYNQVLLFVIFCGFAATQWVDFHDALEELRARGLIVNPSTMNNLTRSGRRLEKRSLQNNSEVSNNSSRIYCAHGEFYAHPESCWHYFVCLDGNFFTRMCRELTYWNDVTKRCERNLEHLCEYDSIHSTLLKADLELHKYCLPGLKINDPKDKKNYYVCYWYYYEKYRCDNGDIFSTTSQKCIPEKLYDSDKHDYQQQLSPEELSQQLEKHTKDQPLRIICSFSRNGYDINQFSQFLTLTETDAMCTHIQFDGGILENSELVLKFRNTVANFTWDVSEKIASLQAKGLKILLSIGDWDDSSNIKYSTLVSSYSNRKNFIKHVMRVLKTYKLDGINLNWEFPVCWQGKCNRGPKSDKEGFASLIEELSEQMRPRGLLLSGAVSSVSHEIDHAYDMPSLIEYLDWITVLAYDFYGPWDGRTGHLAPLYYAGYGKPSYTILSAVNFLLYKGVPRQKIILAVPIFGRTFTLSNLNDGCGFNVNATYGKPGDYYKEPGFLPFFEICSMICVRKGWTVIHDRQRATGPYACKGDQWISYDDRDMLTVKAQFIHNKKLGGGLVSAVDHDDGRGFCNRGQFPLVHTFQKALVDSVYRPTPLGSRLRHKPHGPKNNIKVICYVTSKYSLDDQNETLPFTRVNYTLCTDVIYAYTTFNRSTSSLKIFNLPKMDNLFLKQIRDLRQKGVSVFIALQENQVRYLHYVVTHYYLITKFVNDVVTLIQEFELDGFHLNFKYPRRLGSKDMLHIKTGVMLLAEELSTIFSAKELLLTGEMSSSIRQIDDDDNEDNDDDSDDADDVYNDDAYDIRFIEKYFNWVAVEYTYSILNFKNVNKSVQYWIKKGLSPSKLIVGIPLYRPIYQVQKFLSNQYIKRPVFPIKHLRYYQICQKVLNEGWIVENDTKSETRAQVSNGKYNVTFDGVPQLTLLMKSVNKLNLGGGILWGSEFDDFSNYCQCGQQPMLKTINRILRNHAEIPICSATGKLI